MSSCSLCSSKLREKLPRTSYTGSAYLSDLGFDLLSQMLTYNPKKRITAAEALKHPYFDETPRAQDPSLMPTFPSGNEGKYVLQICLIRALAFSVLLRFFFGCRRRGRPAEGDDSGDIRAKRESEAGGFFLA
jgi:serine/threonine protein kinase